MLCEFDFFFFFKQKTAYEMRISDWSSDVCSSDLNYRAAKHQRADRSDKARSVHQRARGKRAPARAFAGDQRDIFFECLWNGAEQLMCVELGLAHVIMTPHHALGHSGRTTRIDAKQLGGRACDEIGKTWCRKEGGSKWRTWR